MKRNELERNCSNLNSCIYALYSQTDKPTEVAPSLEEEEKAKPASLLQQSRVDYYGSLSDTCSDGLSTNIPMDCLKVNTYNCDNYNWIE